MEIDRISNLDLRDSEIIIPEKVRETLEKDQFLKKVYAYIKESWFKYNIKRMDTI